MTCLETIKKRLISGNLSVTEAIGLVKSDMCDKEAEWELGIFLYENFGKSKLSKTDFLFASRANHRKDSVVVVADSSPDNYWGIQRGARTQLWRPFYDGKISKFYFIQKKFSGIGWNFASDTIGGRLVFTASSVISDETFWFGWEIVRGVWSPVVSLVKPEEWFNSDRVGNYIITDVGKLPKIPLVSRCLGFKKQHSFTCDVKQYADKSNPNVYYIVSEEHGSFNHYLGYGTSIAPGVYRFNQICVKSGKRRNVRTYPVRKY